MTKAPSSRMAKRGFTKKTTPRIRGALRRSWMLANGRDFGCAEASARALDYLRRPWLWCQAAVPLGDRVIVHRWRPPSSRDEPRVRRHLPVVRNRGVEKKEPGSLHPVPRRRVACSGRSRLRERAACRWKSAPAELRSLAGAWLAHREAPQCSEPIRSSRLNEPVREWPVSPRWRAASFLSGVGRPRRLRRGPMVTGGIRR